MDNIEEILNSIMPLIKNDGTIVFEMSEQSKYPLEINGFKAIKDKKYGIKKVIIYKKV